MCVGLGGGLYIYSILSRVSFSKIPAIMKSSYMVLNEALFPDELVCLDISEGLLYLKMMNFPRLSIVAPLISVSQSESSFLPSHETPLQGEYIASICCQC